MLKKDLTVTEIPLGDPGLKDFVKFAWKLYKGDPCWTPPLNGDLLETACWDLTVFLHPNTPTTNMLKSPISWPGEANSQ